jgi:hypothetical protein
MLIHVIVFVMKKTLKIIQTGIVVGAIEMDTQFKIAKV